MHNTVQKLPIKLISLQEARRSIRTTSCRPSVNYSSIQEMPEETQIPSTNPNNFNLRPRSRIMKSPATIHNKNMESSMYLIEKAKNITKAFQDPSSRRGCGSDLTNKGKSQFLEDGVVNQIEYSLNKGFCDDIKAKLFVNNKSADDELKQNISNGTARYFVNKLKGLKIRKIEAVR